MFDLGGGDREWRDEAKGLEDGLTLPLTLTLTLTLTLIPTPANPTWEVVDIGAVWVRVRVRVRVGLL